MNTKVAQDKNLMFCATPNCESILNIKANASKKKKTKIECIKCKKATCSECKM